MSVTEGDRIIVLISANGEWQIVLQQLHPALVNPSPLGDWFTFRMDGRDLIFFHSGWGKTRSAAATQYVIDQYQPKLIINLGTCGGMEGFAQFGDIFLIGETIMYDIYERMGDPTEAVNFYRTHLDTGWLPAKLPNRTKRSKIGSADQDIDIGNYDLLTKQFELPAADWESAAIAWVAHRNSTPCLILRGVSDIVRPHSSETDNNNWLWQERAKQIMIKLLHDLPFYLGFIKALPPR